MIQKISIFAALYELKCRYLRIPNQISFIVVDQMDKIRKYNTVKITPKKSTCSTSMKEFVDSGIVVMVVVMLWLLLRRNGSGKVVDAAAAQWLWITLVAVAAVQSYGSDGACVAEKVRDKVGIKWEFSNLHRNFAFAFYIHKI